MEEIYRILAGRLRNLLRSCRLDFARLQEIRLRAQQPLLLLYGGEEYFVGENSALQKERAGAAIVTRQELQETIEYISNFSLYAFEQELRQGYLTIQGGHRVGMAGKVIWNQRETRNMRYISFLNIRLAHQVKGCADAVLPYLFCEGALCHTLLISPPRCGKTTFLRDLIRQVSIGSRYCSGMTVGVVDERSELGACYQGVPQNDVGCRTDVLDGCPKVEGMMMLVRSMSPQVIAVDEVGSAADVEAMEYAMNCGVRVLATVHGSSLEEIKRKPVLGKMIGEKEFQRYILLEPQTIGQIAAVFDETGRCLFGVNRKHGWEKQVC